jgi:hypothetical protein
MPVPWLDSQPILGQKVFLATDLLPREKELWDFPRKLPVFKGVKHGIPYRYFGYGAGMDHGGGPHQHLEPL